MPKYGIYKGGGVVVWVAGGVWTPASKLGVLCYTDELSLFLSNIYNTYDTLQLRNFNGKILKYQIFEKK